MTDRKALVDKLWNYCHILRDDGITYHQYVTELTYLLFLKMAKETGTEDQLPQGYRWSDLETKAAPDRLIRQNSGDEHHNENHEDHDDGRDLQPKVLVQNLLRINFALTRRSGPL